MIKIVTAQEKHVFAVKPRAVYQRNPDILDHVLNAVRTTNAVALVLPSGEVLAIIGLQVFWSGVGEIWGYTSVLVDKHPIAFYKTCLQMLKDTTKRGHFRRLQINVNASYNQGARFAERIGFNLECRMHKFGPDGDDYYLYGRIF